jgi:hypothetical protein
VTIATRRRQIKVVGFVLFLVMLAAGLLLGTQSSLTLERSESGSVTAVNAWRFSGVPLITRSVTGLREVRIVPMNLSTRDQRSTAYHDVWGRRVVPERVVLVGDNDVEYPYREDVSLIRHFLENPRRDRLQITQPLDVRRKVSSIVLLALAALTTIGAVWQRIAGRDPLSGAPRRVKPLPPAYGTAIFVGGIVVMFWFFTAGHRVFGPLAPRKVNLLMESAKQDDAAGVAKAVNQGVFIDARDGQDMTSLMLAARSGATRAADALLAAGANVGLRDLNDTTALGWAVRTKHFETAKRLFDAGAATEDLDADAVALLRDAGILAPRP